MKAERAIQLSDEQEQRYQAKLALHELFQLSQLVYIDSIQQYGVDAESAARQMEHFDEPTRRKMLAHIVAVMSLNPEYAEEIEWQVNQIKSVFGID